MKRLSALPLATALAGTMLTTPALALTNNKTCAQVQKEFARNGRVTTRSRSGQVLPIYGGVPYLKHKTLICGPSRTSHRTYVITSDKRRCPISIRCV